MQKSYQLSRTDLWTRINEDFGDSGGVYKLFCKKENGKTKPIPRFVDVDIDGILYIGKGVSFLNRVIELKKSIAPEYGSSNHECGVRYKSSEMIKKLFPYKDLWIELNGFDTKDIDQGEKDFLQDYEKEFGELPPLNRAG